MSSLEGSDFKPKGLDNSEERRLNARERKMGRMQLLQIPSAKRSALIRKIQLKLRRKAKEARMWQVFLQTDNLTINGKTVWKNGKIQ
jgi:hypothetical protein